MANAEEMLREAQYEVHCISYGNARANRRHKARAERLATKILRKYPGTGEAKSAYALMMQLGNSAFSDQNGKQKAWQSHHDHGPDPKHRHLLARPKVTTTETANPASNTGELEWSKLLQRLLALPKGVLAALFFVGFLMFSIFGWFFIVLLVAAMLAISPMRGLLPENMRKETEGGIKAVNQWLNGR